MNGGGNPSFLLSSPSFEGGRRGGGDVSPYPSSPSDSASGTPERDFEQQAEVRKLFHLDSLTSTPVGQAPPNSALTAPDVKSGISSAEVSLARMAIGSFGSSIVNHHLRSALEG